jgi:hypothetical protein
MLRFEFESWTFRWSYLYLCSWLENCACLSRGVQVTSVAWRAATRITAGVGDLVQRTGDGRRSRVLGGQMIERSGDIVCGLYHARGAVESGFLC